MKAAAATGRPRAALAKVLDHLQQQQQPQQHQPPPPPPPPQQQQQRRQQLLQPQHMSSAAAAASAAAAVVVVSGKRKVGKDFVCERLLSLLGHTAAEIGRLSAPLKKAFADEHGLDYQELLTDGPYKEKYRREMIVWGEERREKDPGFFARLVMASATKSCVGSMCPGIPSPAAAVPAAGCFLRRHFAVLHADHCSLRPLGARTRA